MNRFRPNLVVSGTEPLHSLARHRRMAGKLLFGQNVFPLGGGTVRVGDPVRIVE